MMPSTVTLDPHELAIEQCYRCGYDLRGVADDQPCPECGLVAINSRRPSEALHHTRPDWLRKISWGLRLIVLSILSLILWPVVAGVLQRMMWGFSYYTRGRWGVPQHYALWRHCVWVCPDVSTIAFAAGVLLLTSREGYAPADRKDAWRRRLLRFAVLPPFIAMAVLHTSTQFEINAMASRASMSWYEVEGAPLIAMLLLTVAMSPLPLLLMYQLRSLAVRARHPVLAEDCAIVGIGNSATLICLPIVWILYNYPTQFGLGENWTSRSPISILLLALAGVASIIFGLWNLYVLIRFSRTFAKASKALRLQWAAHDRSVIA